MATVKGFLAELKQESASTKKILERVPLDKTTWKPHEKSMTLGRLATHIAENSQWISRIIKTDEIDFSKMDFKKNVADNTEELLAIFQSHLDAAITDLEKTEDEELEDIWTVRHGDSILFELPKKVAIRSWAFSHTFHHRGQLSVYLRLLNIPVPGIYGPSADEN